MESIVHFAIPFALASLIGLKPRWVLVTGIFGILPDLDVLTLPHRSGSHSVLFPIMLIPLSAIVKNLKIRSLLIAISIGWLSHILLDFVTWYTPILWPVLQSSFQLVLEWALHIGSLPEFSFNLKLLQKPYEAAPLTTFDGVFFTAEGLALSMVIIILALAKQGLPKILQKNTENGKSS